MTASVGRPIGGGNHRSIESARLRQRFLDYVVAGSSITEARDICGVSVGQYEKWRKRHGDFRWAIDQARTAGGTFDPVLWDGDEAAFVRHYFHMDPADFQLDFIDRMNSLRLGDILMALWPPEHGKTTTFENHASMMLSQNPEWRCTIGSESERIAKKILARIKNRMEPDGPSKQYVRDWGPFIPQFGVGKKVSQPWGDQFLNVFKKSTHDERDNSLQAIGRDSSIVSTRADHLHIDDLQSLKTLGLTTKLVDWFRQDAISRPGEHGITTMAGTIPGPNSVYEVLEEDEELTGILHVRKYPAIVTDALTGEERPLLPQRYTMENLERIKRKSGLEAWDRGYMMEAGRSGVDRVFDDEAIERSKDFEMSLLDPIPDRAPCYITLDPALGGFNCIMTLEIDPDSRLILREIREQKGLRNNEQIMDELGKSVMRARGFGARVTDVVIETMNFQKGLARDERLIELKDQYGFALRDHLSGWNKYDPDIGIASMARSLRLGDIVLPYADDPTTRREIDELIRQLKRWRHGLRGGKSRIDRLMALWFGWILWQNRHKRQTEEQEHDGWKRAGLPFKQLDMGLIVPMNYKVSA